MEEKINTALNFEVGNLWACIDDCYLKMNERKDKKRYLKLFGNEIGNWVNIYGSVFTLNNNFILAVK